MKRRIRILAPLSFALLLAGCSEEPKKASEGPKEPAKPAEPVSAQSAFQQMYVSARGWAPDALPLRLASLTLSEVKNEAGKAGAWECTFVTERTRAARRYTYSVVESNSANIHKGVFGTQPEGWSGSGPNKPFAIQAFKTDSTKAYDVAMQKGAEYAKKHPDVPIKFLLELTPRFPDPAWRVLWGESVGTSNYSVFVDATTGGFLQVAR